MSCIYSILPAGWCFANYSSRYGSSDVSFGRLFWNRRFDLGMIAFLDCLRQLGQYAESKDPAFKLHYPLVLFMVGTSFAR